MDIDIRGRVNNTRLSPTNCLLPLFEAIINSIHAVEEADSRKGRIDVEIVRDRSCQPMQAEGESIALGPIIGFRVRDNGIGFTDKNYRSFETSDTTYKATKGGKGVGRLLWLKAFSRAEIESSYAEGGKHWSRSFDFTYSEKGIEQKFKKEIEANGCQTSVTLIGFRPEYARFCPRRIDTIASRIVEHCLEYFVLSTCPKIVVHDEEEKTDIDLSRLFKNEIEADCEYRTFKIKREKFQLTHVLIRASGDSQDRLHFCAHKRAVDHDALGKRIPNLAQGLKDASDGRQIHYAGYLSASYLDDRVNSERTQFDIFEEMKLELPGELTWDDIRQGAYDQVVGYLAPYIDPIKKAKEERIRKYVEDKAPQYRPLLKHRSSYIDDIAPNLTDDRLEIELYRADQKYDSELKEMSCFRRNWSDAIAELYTTRRESLPCKSVVGTLRRLKKSPFCAGI